MTEPTRKGFGTQLIGKMLACGFDAAVAYCIICEDCEQGDDDECATVGRRRPRSPSKSDMYTSSAAYRGRAL